jgi:hypothetical protein
MGLYFFIVEAKRRLLTARRLNLAKCGYIGITMAKDDTPIIYQWTNGIRNFIKKSLTISSIVIY